MHGFIVHLLSWVLIVNGQLVQRLVLNKKFRVRKNKHGKWQDQQRHYKKNVARISSVR